LPEKGKFLKKKGKKNRDNRGRQNLWRTKHKILLFSFSPQSTFGLKVSKKNTREKPIFQILTLANTRNMKGKENQNKNYLFFLLSFLFLVN